MSAQVPFHRDTCEVCGQAVQVTTSDDGTSHYVGIDAWDANTLRAEREDAIASATLTLAQALRLIRDTSTGATSNIAARALKQAGIEDPEDDCAIF
jgi:hypothetical protein